MNLHLKLENILFLDIETVPQEASWDNVSENTKHLFEQKTAYQRKEEIAVEDFYERAGIWAEFGKIICISVGYFVTQKNEKQLRVKSFFGADEKEILEGFKNLLDSHFNRNEHVLCAHNGKEFDFPYIARRGLINGLKIPSILDLAGKKPWEVNHLDTLHLWKFGDYKNYTSLNLLTTIFNIPTPKDDIDGSMVNEVYWKENDLERIANYCQKDVVALTQLFLRFKNEPLISENNVIIN